jgi:hypothetical protein
METDLLDAETRVPEAAALTQRATYRTPSFFQTNSEL